MKIMMAATGIFAEPILESLLPFNLLGLITQPDNGPISKRGSTKQNGKGVKFIAETNNVPVFQPENINDFIKTIEELKPDLIVVAAYGQILSKEFLSCCNLVVNVHASLLPKYRGSAPIAHAILNDEQETGVTLIKIDPGVDSGDIIDARSLAISPDDTTGSLEHKLSLLGANCITDFVNNKDFVFTKQNANLVTKAPRIKKEFGLVDWTNKADYICRHVRAMQPWPTAYTYLLQEGKEPIRISLVKTKETEEAADKPGEVSFSQGLLKVSAADKKVTLEVVHPAGKKVMSGADFFRGLKGNNLRMSGTCKE